MCAAMDSVPSAANAVLYASRLHDKYIEREVAALVQHGTMALENDGLSASEKVEQIASMAKLANEFGTPDDKMTVSDMIGRLSQDLTAGGLRSVSTGLNALDGIIGGVGAGQLILVAGATSMGKTSLLLDIFIHLARIGQRPYYYYLEMLAAHLGQRLVMNISRVPKELVEAGSDSIRETLMLTESWPAWIEPNPKPDIESIVTMVAAQKAKRDIGAVFIDHVQKIYAPGRGSVEQISFVSNALSIMACDLKIPVIAACHVNRETLHRDNHIPKLSDLRGSGSLENDSDVVIVIHREDYYREQKDENPELDGVAKAYVLKNRQGRKGIAELVWMPEYCSFSDPARDENLPF
jgi:replicative DNA helicase